MDLESGGMRSKYIASKYVSIDLIMIMLFNFLYNL